MTGAVDEDPAAMVTDCSGDNDRRARVIGESSKHLDLSAVSGWRGGRRGCGDGQRDSSNEGRGFELVRHENPQWMSVSRPDDVMCPSQPVARARIVTLGGDYGSPLRVNR